MKKDSRIVDIVNQIVKFSQGDFDGHIQVSEKMDGIDAIGAALNALGEILHFKCCFSERHDDMTKPTTDFEGCRELQLAAIFENAPDAIVMADSTGAICRWNHQAEKIFSWKKGEVIGKSLSEVLVPARYRERHDAALQKFLDTGMRLLSDKPVQFPALCKDGREIEIEMTISSTFLGTRYHFIGFIRDITHRAAADRELKAMNAELQSRLKIESTELLAKESKYRNLFANNPMAMWVVDTPTLRFIDVNESAIQQYGYSREEFLSMTILDIRPPEDKKKIQKLNREERGTINRGIWRHLKKNGSIIYAEVIVHEIQINGQPARLILSNDVTERKLNEEALRISEARFRKIFDSSLVGFIVWSSDRRVVQVNDRFLQMLRYNREDFVRNEIDWMKITPQEFWEQDAGVIAALAHESSCDPFENEFIRKDGSRMQALVSAVGIDKGLYVTSIVDLSHQKQLAEQIQDLNKNLEQRVKERTEELLLVNKELESFTYTVSHDLRAPLRAVHGYSQILVEEHADQLDDDAHRILNNVQSNAKKMGQLVDDLLTFSRMGKRAVNQARVDLNAIVGNVLSALIGPSRTELHVKVQSLGTVIADPALIQLVFQNLIDNAIKYTGKTDNPCIEVGVANINNVDTYFVRDNGAGFDMRYYDKLFGVFQRLHTEDEFDGTGVGLAIVHRIVSKHGGSVWAEAEVDKGATFYFTLTNPLTE